MWSGDLQKGQVGSDNNFFFKAIIHILDPQFLWIGVVSLVSFTLQDELYL